MARLLLLPLIIGMVIGCGQGQIPDPTPLASVLTPEAAPVSTPEPTHTPEPTPMPERQRPVLRIAPTVTPVPPGDPTPTPSATPIATQTPVPSATPIPELSPEQATLMATGIFNAMFRNLIEQYPDSTDFVVEYVQEGGDQRTEWNVSYSGMLQGEDAGRAWGTYVDRAANRVSVFVSDHSNTCLKNIHPQISEWKHIEHDGWVRAYNRGKFLPPMPWMFARMDFVEDWRVADITDSEVVVSHTPDPDTGFQLMVYFSKGVPLVVREVTSVPELATSVMVYKWYGTFDVSYADFDLSDCEVLRSAEANISVVAMGRCQPRLLEAPG